jgi:DnaJ domain
MMSDATAVRVAIDIVQVPSRVRYYRLEPLPKDVLTLLRVAAGDEPAEIAAAESVGRSRSLVRAGAAFFIEQILLGPDADSYRVLGADPTATPAELRRNMALMLRWLHPDVDRQGVRSLFATRVTQAWETLKTPERRAAYDQERSRAAGGRSRRRRRRAKSKSHAAASALMDWQHGPKGFFRRAVWRLLGARY